MKSNASHALSTYLLCYEPLFEPSLHGKRRERVGKRTVCPARPLVSDVVGGMQSADAKSQECVTASLIGGLLGGMMAEGTNTAKGTAAGAGIGMLGCVALKANAREAKEAQAKPSPAPTTP